MLYCAYDKSAKIKTINVCYNLFYLFQVPETHHQKRLVSKWLLAVTTIYSDNDREGQKILKRSNVCPSGHMDSSGVASACKLDTRSQTFTWMTSNMSMCVFVFQRWGWGCAYVLCVHSGSLCYLSGDPGTCWWRNQVRESSCGYKLPFCPGSLSHQSVILAAGHSNMHLVCLPDCLSLVQTLTPSMSQFL